MHVAHNKISKWRKSACMIFCEWYQGVTVELWEIWLPQTTVNLCMIAYSSAMSWIQLDDQRWKVSWKVSFYCCCMLLLRINILLTWFNNSACITIMVEGNFRLIVILITKKIIIIPVDLIWEYLIYYKSCSCSTWRLAMKGIVLISLTVFMQWRIFWSACANNAYFPKKTASSAGLKEDTCQVVV